MVISAVVGKQVSSTYLIYSGGSPNEYYREQILQTLIELESELVLDEDGHWQKEKRNQAT